MSPRRGPRKQDIMAPDMIAPPSAPMMTTAPEILKEDEPADIPDPVVPETLKAALAADGASAAVPNDEYGKHEALLQGAVQYLSTKLADEFNTYAKHLMKELDDVCGYVTQ